MRKARSCGLFCFTCLLLPHAALAAQGPDIRAPGAPEVELNTGALRLERTDLTVAAPGMDLVLARSYTSAGIALNEFGWGWSLAGLMRLRVNHDGTVELHEGGERYVFSTNGPYADESTLTALGHPGELRKKRNGGWFILYGNGSYAEFNKQGYMERMRDGHRKNKNSGSEIE